MRDHRVDIPDDPDPPREEAERELYKFTPDVAAKIVLCLRSGAFVETAAAAAGITKKTFYFWLKRGARKKTGKLRKFSDDVLKAMADFEIEAANGIRAAGQQNWQAYAWLLERKYPREWGRVERLEHTGAAGGPIEQKIDNSVTSETVMDGLRRLAGIADEGTKTQAKAEDAEG